MIAHVNIFDRLPNTSPPKTNRKKKKKKTTTTTTLEAQHDEEEKGREENRDERDEDWKMSSCCEESRERERAFEACRLRESQARGENHRLREKLDTEMEENQRL